MANSAVREQIEYYRARSGEYDDFWFRRGAYALEPPLDAQWRADAAEAERAVFDWVPRGGDVLELACGTGLWTRLLAAHAARVVAVDASPEMIELNRRRVGNADVTYVVADAFAWPFPPGRFDGVMFGYWHSHIPDDRLAPFWDAVRSSLRPGGLVMLVDRAPYPPGAPGDAAARAEHRTLSDGRRFEVVKRYWAPAELTAHLARLGWDCPARTTRNGLILLAELAPT